MSSNSNVSENRELFEQICAAMNVVDQEDLQVLTTLYQPLLSGEMDAQQHYLWLKEQYKVYDGRNGYT